MTDTATFNKSQIKVFDRSGSPIGVLSTWAITSPRSYRLNEIEDFGFSIPRSRDGVLVLNDSTMNLLKRDNLIYIENQLYGMRGWAGAITEVTFGGDIAEVVVNGAASLLMELDTTRIEQQEGYAWTIASRLVSAAQAKQAAHNDLVVSFAPIHPAAGASASRRNYGKFEYEGDILAGLQQLAEDTQCEFFVTSKIGVDGNLDVQLNWGGRFKYDRSASQTDPAWQAPWMRDGEGGNITPGNKVTYSVVDIANRIRMRGTPTEIGTYVDYDCVRSVIKEIVPEVEYVLDDVTSTNYRRRESMSMTVSFGYSEAIQRALAAEIQERYLYYYKRFLYAYHNIKGRPYLDGYEWGGPDGNNDKKLTERFYRTYQRLGYIGTRTVVTGDSDNNSVDAKIDEWVYQQTVATNGDIVGIALNHLDTTLRFIASTDGNVYELAEDQQNVTSWLKVTGTGETLRGVATDPAQASTVWVLISNGSTTLIRWYDYFTFTKLGEYTLSSRPNANDLSVDSVLGNLYVIGSDNSGNVETRDLNNGTLVSSFSSGYSTPTGLSVTGGLAYVVNSTGSIRMLFIDDGNFAGSFATNIACNGVFTDPSGGEIWIVNTAGDALVYDANVAVATVPDAGSVDGAPGFDEIVKGQHVHVVADGTTAYAGANNKVVITYSPGSYVDETEVSELGQPDRISRTWVTKDQVTAFSDRTKVRDADPESVIQGEESRVCDWNPKIDGTGAWRSQYFRTVRGRSLAGGLNWWPKEWNIPDRDFEVNPPVWPEGQAYLSEYIQRNNKERAVQTLMVTNAGGMWRYMVLGGIYEVRVSNQGGQTGLSGKIRVLEYTPDDLTGVMEVVGEWL